MTTVYYECPECGEEWGTEDGLNECLNCQGLGTAVAEWCNECDDTSIGHWCPLSVGLTWRDILGEAA